MAKSELLRLAEGGLADFPPARLDDLAVACRESATATGSPRLFMLASAIGLLASAWEPHEAVPVGVTRDLDHLIADRVPLILAEVNEDAAVSIAASFQQDLILILGGAW